MKRPLGPWRVHPVVFGGMNLSIEGRPERSDAIATIRAARDAGAEVFDTADVYGLVDEPHHNEALMREALGADATITTKGGVRRVADRWEHHAHPDDLEKACEASLRVLGTIGLYQLHAVDAEVPIEESVGSLKRLQERGWIEHIGVSNVSFDQLVRAMQSATIVSVQNEASPYVAPDRRILDLCASSGIAFLAYAPMGGWRAGRTAHLPELCEAAEEHACSPFEVVVRWLLGASPWLLPVCGASKAANAQSSILQTEPLEPGWVERLSRALWEPLGAR